MSEFFEQFVVQVFSIDDHAFHGIVFSRRMKRVGDRMVLFAMPPMDIAVGDELHLTSHRANLYWSMARKAWPAT